MRRWLKKILDGVVKNFPRNLEHHAKDDSLIN